MRLDLLAFLTEESKSFSVVKSLDGYMTAWEGEELPKVRPDMQRVNGPHSELHCSHCKFNELSPKPSLKLSSEEFSPEGAFHSQELHIQKDTDSTLCVHPNHGEQNNKFNTEKNDQMLTHFFTTCYELWPESKDTESMSQSNKTDKPEVLVPPQTVPRDVALFSKEHLSDLSELNQEPYEVVENPNIFLNPINSCSESLTLDSQPELVVTNTVYTDSTTEEGLPVSEKAEQPVHFTSDFFLPQAVDFPQQDPRIRFRHRTSMCSPRNESPTSSTDSRSNSTVFRSKKDLFLHTDTQIKNSSKMLVDLRPNIESTQVPCHPNSSLQKFCSLKPSSLSSKQSKTKFNISSKSRFKHSKTQCAHSLPYFYRSKKKTVVSDPETKRANKALPSSVVVESLSEHEVRKIASSFDAGNSPSEPSVARSSFQASCSLHEGGTFLSDNHIPVCTPNLSPAPSVNTTNYNLSQENVGLKVDVEETMTNSDLLTTRMKKNPHTSCERSSRVVPYSSNSDFNFASHLSAKQASESKFFSTPLLQSEVSIPQALLDYESEDDEEVRDTIKTSASNSGFFTLPFGVSATTKNAVRPSTSHIIFSKQFDESLSKKNWPRLPTKRDGAKAGIRSSQDTFNKLVPLLVDMELVRWCDEEKLEFKIRDNCTEEVVDYWSKDDLGQRYFTPSWNNLAQRVRNSWMNNHGYFQRPEGKYRTQRKCKGESVCEWRSESRVFRFHESRKKQIKDWIEDCKAAKRLQKKEFKSIKIDDGAD